MKTLKKELSRSDDVLFVFYDFETTQDKKFSDKANVHIPMTFVYNSSVRLARCKTPSTWIVSAVVGDAILSSRIPYGTCYLISANLDLGVKRPWR